MQLTCKKDIFMIFVCVCAASQDARDDGTNEATDESGTKCLAKSECVCAAIVTRLYSFAVAILPCTH